MARNCNQFWSSIKGIEDVRTFGSDASNNHSTESESYLLQIEGDKKVEALEAMIK